MDSLKYPKDLVLELECEDNLVNRASSAPPLTNYSFEGYSEDGNGATTP